MNIKIEFNIENLPLFFVSHKGGRKTFEVGAFDGILTASAQYDYDRLPLSLSNRIDVGDRVEIVLMDHRIELHVIS